MSTPEPSENLPYRFRYMNGAVSKGGFKTFEAAISSFMDCKHSGKYAKLYSDLKDVVCVERTRDYVVL